MYVRPSVCDTVECALWLSGLVYNANSCAIVFLAGLFLFVSLITFAVRCIFSENILAKNEMENAVLGLWNQDHTPARVEMAQHALLLLTQWRAQQPIRQQEVGV